MKNTKVQTPIKKFNSNNDSFLEAFRDIGGDFANTAKNDLLKKGTQDIFDSLSPFSKAKGEENKPFPPFPGARENEWERKYHSMTRRTEVVHREERVLFTRQQKETQQQVKALQQEIVSLAKATDDLAREVETAAIQETPVVGSYHVSFFERLRTLLKRLRAEIQESSFWLSAWNKKSQKKNHYWNQFKKSGSKFLLSSDRYMSTQAG
ncbi:MAG: DUF5660 domain-containing protein [Patescibacteria group bacterium]|nr:DUF5660 domain-containing protein [Patescibacteria group bacterium]